MIPRSRIDESLAGAQVLDRGGYAYVVHPLMDGVPRVDPALLIQFADWAFDVPEMQGTTVLLAPEAMGVPLAAAVAMKTGIPYLVARKRSYGLPGETSAHVQTGYGQDRVHVNGLKAGDRVLVVDDVISTGGTLGGLLTALHEAGVEVRGVVAFVDKGDKAQELAKVHGVPVHVMRRIRIVDGRVEVLQ